MSAPSTTAVPDAPDETSVPSATDPAGGGATGHRWRRWLLFGSAGILLVVAVVFVAATLRLFVFPATDQPAHVNGILSLNGNDEPTREALAVSLAGRDTPRSSSSPRVERRPTPRARRCPGWPWCASWTAPATRGARRSSRGGTPRRHHWHSLMIVPGRDQVTRARLLTERCFSGRVVVVPISGSRPPLRDVVHQWGGLFDSLLVHRGC